MLINLEGPSVYFTEIQSEECLLWEKVSELNKIHKQIRIPVSPVLVNTFIYSLENKIFGKIKEDIMLGAYPAFIFCS